MLMRIIIFLAFGLFGAAVTAEAASIPLIIGPAADVNPQTAAIVNPVIAQMNQLITPQTMASWGIFRNLLHNGEHLISQRDPPNSGVNNGSFSLGCDIARGAGYFSDRWCENNNTGTGDGAAAIVSSTPTAPPGFTNAMRVYRNSGSDVQQICQLQEIPSAEIVGVIGQPLIFSMYVQPYLGLTSTGGLIKAYFFQGTVADQGLGKLRSNVGMTASPAITPAWTGISGGTTPLSPGVQVGVIPASPSWSVGTTAVWTRLWTAPFIVASNTLEAAIAVCFTPVGSVGGSPDGFAVTGEQLEVVQPNQFDPSPYEHVPPAIEMLRAQRYYWQINETNGTFYSSGACSATNVDSVPMQLPVSMDITPVVGFTAGGFQLVINGATGAGISGSTTVVSTPQFASLKFTNACTAGQTVLLKGSDTTGLISFSADF